MNSISTTHTIAIIGAGFSGVATVVNLLRRGASPGLRVVLINRSGPLARGVAYGTNTPTHVLNVPVGRMGAFPDAEDHFLRFLQARSPSTTSGQFVARQLYGEYLEWLLREAQALHAESRRFSQVVAHVTDIQLQADGTCRIALDGGSTLHADRVVLAIGNYPPVDPDVPDAAFFCGDPRYIRDPWERGRLRDVDRDRPILVIGTGLTMYDAVLELQSYGYSARIYAISRRGLLPRPHRSPALPPRSVSLPDELLTGTKTILQYVRLVRSTVQRAGDSDWRDILASIRAITPALWQALPLTERARFLRHLLPYWDVHRHRAAPDVFRDIERLAGTGRLVVTAGRLLRLEPASRIVTAWFRQRGRAASASLEVGTVINCTGPNTDINRIDDPLLGSLRRQGLLVPDPLGLGVEITDDYALINARGTASRSLYYIGPFLRAKYWESTAVPELRVHAQRLADHLLTAEDSVRYQ